MGETEDFCGFHADRRLLISVFNRWPVPLLPMVVHLVIELGLPAGNMRFALTIAALLALIALR
jgi:hypothetical protein